MVFFRRDALKEQLRKDQVRASYSNIKRKHSFFEKTPSERERGREREIFAVTAVRQNRGKHTNQQPNEHNTYDMIDVLKK